MANKYVSLAIDHGTTNSCIAVMSAEGPRVIPAESNSVLLPSAVFYDAKGGLRVGSQAREAMMTSSAARGQGFTGYKLHIGGDRRYDFKAAGKSLTAPEMGAVIIQNLLRAYYKESGVDARACVITIPAKFKLNAVEGTRAAAEMAGLKYYPLLMEPVAAAMRYGFTATEQRAEWMVFDLGGGTLDVSMVIVRRGKMVVPDGGHAGDDSLGGSKFDQELSGYVLKELEKRHPLTKFRQNREQYSNEWGRLLLAVEEAKIALSTRRDSVVSLDQPLCRDDRGHEVEVEVPVTRKLYEDLIRPDAERAVQICRTLLKNNRVSPQQVEKLILVGGPSKTPLIQQMLTDRLGIRLESSVDPMTAVAEGAAIYADTVELPPELGAESQRSAAGYAIRIECERHSAVPTYCIVGMVDGPPARGARVEVERLDGFWKSTEIPVDASGVFTAELTLIEGDRPTLSEFKTTLMDGTGKVLTAVDEPQIWYPYPVVENRLASSLRVAIKGGGTKVLIEQGAELPAEGLDDFVTTKPLRRGTTDDVLRVPVLESIANLLGHEDDAAGSCLHVGTLRIHGSDHRITMDVPEGSDIQVALKVDDSRNIKALASIILLNADFEATFVGETFQYELKDLRERSETLEYALEKIKKLQGERSSPEVGEALGALERTGLKAGIDTDFERAGTGDRDAEVRGYKRLLEMEGTVHELQRMQRRPRIERALETLGRVVQGEERRMLDDIGKEYSGAESEDDLARCLKSVEELEYAVRGLPWQNLQLDVMALSGLKVTAHQHGLFAAASALLQRVNAGGGVEKASDGDIADMVRMHHELNDAHSDLYELRQKTLDEMGLKRADQIGADIDVAKK